MELIVPGTGTGTVPVAGSGSFVAANANTIAATSKHPFSSQFIAREKLAILII
jgi:hypothetical protein